MKRKLSPEELRLWQAQLQGVAPLSKKNKVTEDSSLPKNPKPIPPQHRSAKMSKEIPIPIPTNQPQSFGRKELRHLKIEGRLDMHGMTMNEGYDALEQFLIRAQEKGFKTVLIITGKGPLSSENT